MDVVNFDALKAQGRIIKKADVDPEKDYFILGHYDPRRREFKATDYPIYIIKAGDVMGPFMSNADRQMSNSTANISTTSSSYIDLPGMSLTTKELGTVTSPATGNYQVHFAATYYMSDLFSTAQFILNVGGIDVATSQISEGPADLNLHRTTIIWQVEDLPVNTIIKIRFKVTPDDPGTSAVNVTQRTLMINGVNTETVI